MLLGHNRKMTGVPSAHFGVVGRIIGSFLSLLTAISFYAISVWSSGDALVGAAHRLGRARAVRTHRIRAGRDRLRRAERCEKHRQEG